jgi:hypothetical protein
VIEDVAGEHTAEAQAKPHIQAGGGSIEHFPEPDQGLANCKLDGIDIGEVLGVEGDIFGIEGEAEDVPGKFAGEGDIGLGPVRTSEIELVELIADDFSAALRRAVPVELLVEEAYPATKNLFGFGRGMRLGGGDRLGRGIRRHMCMDDKSTGRDAREGLSWFDGCSYPTPFAKARNWWGTWHCRGGHADEGERGLS